MLRALEDHLVSRELGGATGLEAVLVPGEDEEAVRVVEVLQVRLQQVGHPALPPQRDQEVDLERIHLLGGKSVMLG